MPVRFRKLAEPPVDPGPRLLNIQEAAKYLSAHVHFIRTKIRSRELPHLRLGKRFVIDKRDLDKFVEREKIGVI